MMEDRSALGPNLLQTPRLNILPLTLEQLKKASYRFIYIAKGAWSTL